MNRFIPVVLMLLMMVPTSWAQNEKVSSYVRCGSVEHEERLQALYPDRKSVAEFESWMAQKIQERKDNPNARAATYRIPYIVHVVHAGEAEGTGDNLSEAQVNAQMKQVNDDFTRMNSDASNTPADFLPVASGLDIEFVPAVVDLDGNILAQPGIHRVNGQADFGISSWGSGTIDATLKPATSWDPNLVFNIWSCNLGGGLLGYAQFPEAPTLPGIGTGNGPSNTDGVVMASGTFGSLDVPGTLTPYHLGRTLTHELGHWAGLRHIWGDGGCGADDFCDDTPTAGGSNGTGVPCTYPGPNSCTDAGTDLPDMFQNFMDYSDDACMNLFTVDQADRMIIVFENSPYRDTLNESTIWQFPSADTIIAGISQDGSVGCAPFDVVFSDDSYVGDSAVAITSWEWNFDVNAFGGASPATFSGESPSTVTFSNTGTYTISLTIDNGVYTSVKTTTVTVEGVIDLDISVDFESGVPMDWSNDGWLAATTGFGSANAVYQDNWGNNGEVSSYLTSPNINFDVAATVIQLSFDVAHKNYVLSQNTGAGGGLDEGMAVEVSTDCGVTWTEVWKKLDGDTPPFYTVGPPDEAGAQWAVSSDDDWRREEVDLTAYKGESSVRVRLVGLSDFGQDTYLDNIIIEEITVSPISIEAEFTSSAEVICAGQSADFTSTSTLGSGITDAVYEWNFDVDGLGGASPATFTGETPPSVTYATSGVYTIELTISSAANSNSDTYSLTLDVGGALDLPFAEDFESAIFPPGDIEVDAGWLSSLGFTSSYGTVADNFNEENLVADMYLPALDFSAVGLATLSFDISHTFFPAGIFNPQLNDTLQISYSLDCGDTWTALWRKDDGDPLNPLFTVDGGAQGEFVPASDDDWRHEEVDVTFLKGNDNVKIRFENRGGFGNQLYLDNINVDAELVADDEVFAYFTTDASGGCVGSAIDFADFSTAGANTTITSWEWNFDLNGIGTATPSTFSGQTPPAVSFDEPGVYDVQLTVSDGTVSDDYTTQISIEVPVDLTYTQDFSASAFPPEGWTNILWGQAAESTDPLLGSLFADNWGVQGLKAYATTPSFDMSWYDQIEMSFDVAHGRFSANENEGLVISSSADCALTWSEIWSKYDFDADPLYTVSSTGSEFIPADASEWREETVDLSALNNNSSVKLQLFSDGFFGNNTFVDDLKIEGWLFNPTDLEASLSGTNNIDLTWTDNSGKETAYDVMRWNPATSAFDVIATLGANASSYTDAGLSGPAEYTYQVCAYNEKARACSNEASDSTEAVLIVSGLIAEVSDQSGTSIELHWDDLSTTEDGFLIKRSEDNFATFEVINVLTPDQNYYLDEFLEETVTYTYQVCAFNALDTVESNTDDATTDINAASSLTATTVENNVALSWDDNSSVEEGFQIKRSLTPGGPYTTVATVGPNVTAYTDFGLEPLTEYCYVVCAFNAVDVGCTDEQCTTTDISSSVFDDLTKAITLYPNPANEFVELQLSSIKGKVEVKVFNQIGELMNTQIMNGGSVQRLNVNDLAGGIYMIRFQTEDGFTTKKLVVE